MTTLNVFGRIDQIIEGVTREQLDAALDQGQLGVVMYSVEIPGNSIQLVTRGAFKGATLRVVTVDSVERKEFDNIAEAISTFRELTAHLF